MNFRSIFFGRDNVLRSGWRFAIFIALFIFAGAIAGTLVSSMLGGIAISGEASTTVFLSINGAVSLMLALVIGAFCARYLEKLPFRSLGAWFTGGWLWHLILGAAIGAATVSIAASIVVVAGGVTFQLNSATSSEIASTLLRALVIFTIAGAFEEALFRGYILQTFARAGLAWFAIALTSLFFAVVHLGNPNANWISSINTGLAGVWFGIAYLKTRDLWFVTGLHVLWNWVQGAIFGIEVSGLTDLIAAPLMKEVDLGPTWLTGGSYGLEGGIVTTIAIVISIAAIQLLPIFRPDPELLAMTSPQADQAGKVSPTTYLS